MIHALLATTLALVLQQGESPAVQGRLKGHAKGKPLDAAELQAEVAKLRPQVEKVRGETFQKDVALLVLEGDAFAARLRQHVAAERAADEVALEGVVAQLFGAIPGTMDWAAEECAARERRLVSFYDAHDDTLVIQAGLAPGTARALLTRGLASALDDQTFDLEAFARGAAGNADARRALQAVTEGSSMGVMRSWALQNLGAVMPEDMTDATSRGIDELADAPPFLWKPDCFDGLQGAAFLLKLDDFRKAGNRSFAGKELATVFRDPPRSSEQVLHPEKYWDPALRDDPVAVRLAVDALPDGWSLRGEDTLGELGWALVVEPLDVRGGLNAKSMGKVKFSFRPSIGWGGDRFVLLGRDERRVLVCETVWDTPEDVTEFGRALEAHAESFRAAAAAYAAKHGLPEAESGFEFAPRDERGMSVVVWAGAADEERGRLRSAVRVEMPR